ncbi:NAD(P)-dependent alcohol dehydrogenase [Dyella sp. C11]|uniref:NAD(P)-dependent alcohol dehydrogenase n=1 Tax=Dyella sp. C11 TaxID=2126991 RepID=UPI000D649C93|nr:NAD(P)-dependent alcohol dehydrogenase [Dyella sp. C11]
MKAARLHEYGKPLVIEDIPIPEIQADEILVKVTACGVCRTDAELIDGYFNRYFEIPTPITLGHEIAGEVAEMGRDVPSSAFQKGDHVVVVPGWGDGTCRHCQVGNTQLCPNVRYPGFGPYGGFAEYLPVPARYLIKVGKSLKSEELAPLTDAGLTPFRAIKKLRRADALGPDRVLGVFGLGGLGGYAVQYAKLQGGGATIVVFERDARKLEMAKTYGADVAVNITDRSATDVANELEAATGQRDLDAIIDCVGTPEMMQFGFSLLGISGHYVDVGLLGDRIDIPLFPRINREQSFYGSNWGNFTDLSEVMSLAAKGKIQHNIKTIGFDQLNETIDALRHGKISGRAVLKIDGK